MISLKADKEQIENIEKDLAKIRSEIRFLESEINQKEEKIKILGTVPCGSTFPECRFLVDGFKQEKLIKEVQNNLSEYKLTEGEYLSKLEQLKPSLDKIQEVLKYKDLLQKLELELKDKQLKFERNRNILRSFEVNKTEQEQKKKIYQENEVWMKELKSLEKERLQLKLTLQNDQGTIDRLEKTNNRTQSKNRFK
mgnify:FL=1